jgi:hypothetical protein
LDIKYKCSVSNAFNLEGIDLNDWPVHEIYALYVTRGRACADISKLKDGEIIRLHPKNPVHISEEWDGVLDNSLPRIGDFGINNKRQVFVYLAKDKWRYCYG